MKKRRHHKAEELLLIPFLDILCSLIGVLVLIIVVMCVAQSQRAKGRTQEELERSKQYVEALKKTEILKDVSKELQAKMAKLEEMRKENEDKQTRLAKLRKLLASSADIQAMNEKFSEELMKELDNLMVEIDGLNRHEKDILKEVAALVEELKKRQIPPDKKTPPVVVQPGGSGLAEGSKLFFVEATGGKLVIYWSADQKTVLAATDDVVATDPPFQHFLKTVGSSPKAKVIFLLRDDGMNAFNKAAGWAQMTYNYGVDQIGRLPIPGRGEIDLKMFNQYLGSMPPPPDAKIMAPGTGVPPPPAAAPKPPAPAPATPAAAAPAKA